MIVPALILGCMLSGQAQAQPGGSDIVVDRFSAETEPDGLPKGWKRLQFRTVPSRTDYSVERDSDNYFVRAVSSANGTGILKEVAVDVTQTPYLSWRWKVSNILKTADVETKDGDDYPGRVYVAFAFDPKKTKMFKRVKYRAAKAKFGDLLPAAALIYIWDNTHPVGSFYKNAFTSGARMVIVESGGGKVGQWVPEKRNVYEDYKKAFGTEPPQTLFVAVMTDTDNTGESATGWYDDLVFSEK